MRPSWQHYRALLETYVAPQRPSVALLAILIIGTTALQLIGPQVLGRFIDAAQAGDPLRSLLVLAAVFLVVAALTQVITMAAQYWSERIGWRATNTLRADLLDHCLRLPMPFHHGHTPGEMVERIDGDVTALANFFGQFVIQIVGNALLLVGVLAVLFWEDWRVGAALAVFSMITVLVLLRSRNLAVPAFGAERQATAELYGFLEERIAGIDDVRANGAGAYMQRRFFEHSRAQFRAGIKADLLGASLWSISTTLFAAGYVLALLLGIMLYQRGAVTLGAVFLIFQYTALLQRPLTALTRELQDLQQAGAGVVRIGELFSVRPLANAGTQTVPPGALAVQLRNVTFSYDGANNHLDGTWGTGDRNTKEEGTIFQPSNLQTSHQLTPQPHALDNISFDLRLGEVLGLLGRTGSGKTTLTRLLVRLYAPQTGTIHLGGVPLEHVQAIDLHARVGVVTQDVHLFAGTVRDNLALFDPAIDDQHMLDALDALGLRRWLDGLPHGLNTELATGGAGLSAGEAQLLALTRVFLRDPGLIILDEASSRLDPATEQLLSEAIARLLHNRSAIIIAHRLQTVERADTIMILEHGRIAEYGARAPLANDPDSRFAHLLRTGLEVLA